MHKSIPIIISLFLIINFDGTAQNQFDSETFNTRIDNYLISSVENGYSGSILVAKDGEVLFQKDMDGLIKQKKYQTSLQQYSILAQLLNSLLLLPF